MGLATWFRELISRFGQVCYTLHSIKLERVAPRIIYQNSSKTFQKGLYCYQQKAKLNNSIKANGNIECGALCSAQFDGGCHLYAPQKDTKTCHLGYFDNTETNYLTGQSGIQPVYLSISKK